ncbi:MAG: glucodextranase DOMON-like domain-containing protein, partial [Rubrivivax sp.]
VDNLDAGPAHAPLQRLFDIHGDAPERLAADGQGRVHLRLPPRSGTVWAVGSPERALDPSLNPTLNPTMTRPVLDALPPEPLTGDFTVTGQAPPGTELALIVDGDEARAQRVRAAADGRFTARIDTRRMSDPKQLHRMVARALPATESSAREPGAAGRTTPDVVSNALSFCVALPWQTLADVPQPPQAGGGPEGTYRYPTHESYTRQMDLQRTRVLAAGGALRIELEMADLTRVWGPANGFDHVAFSIFIELPGEEGGARVMPGQNAELPQGMRWHRRLRAHGWSNAMFGPEGASATADGRSITPAAAIETDASQRRVVFTIPSEALGDPARFSGARVWVTTWDWDGTWRPLAAEAGSFIVGGGAPDGPKFWSASPVIRLP